MGQTLICDFCKQPITNIVAKFRHEVSTANFMMGLLPEKEEICDICYTSAKSNPPTKEEIDKGNSERVESANKMWEDFLKL